MDWLLITFLWLASDALAFLVGWGVGRAGNGRGGPPRGSNGERQYVRRAALIGLLGLAVLGCQAPRYQLVPAGDGLVYRLDTRTGAMLVVAYDRAWPVAHYPTRPAE